METERTPLRRRKWLGCRLLKSEVYYNLLTLHCRAFEMALLVNSHIADRRLVRSGWPRYPGPSTASLARNSWNSMEHEPSTNLLRQGGRSRYVLVEFSADS